MKAVVALLSGAVLVAAACALDHEPTSAGGTGDAGAGAGLGDSAVADGSVTAAGMPLAVELGTGSSFFVPLHDGDAVTMVRGKQGFQHVWISARILQPGVRDAIVTISTHLPDGRPGGPPISTAVTLDPIDGGVGAEKVGLTGLVDYAVIGNSVRVRLEIKTPDGVYSGADERSVDVLAPINYACAGDAGATSCAALCAGSSCSTCETGSDSVGFVDAPDASVSVVSCTAPLDAGPAGAFTCCCCR